MNILFSSSDFGFNSTRLQCLKLKVIAWLTARASDCIISHPRGSKLKVIRINTAVCRFVA